MFGVYYKSAQANRADLAEGREYLRGFRRRKFLARRIRIRRKLWELWYGGKIGTRCLADCLAKTLPRTV